MSIEHLGVQPLEHDHLPATELPQNARLYILRSQEVRERDKADLHEIGLEFLEQLDDASFRMRFGSPKPHLARLGRLVDHFLEGRVHPHAMMLLLHEQRLLGAASIFHHTLRASAYSEPIDTTHVAELSVTIADDLHGQGLGKLLLSQARQFAVDAGYTHAYFGFEPTNEPSRRMVERVCGADQLVAGAANPRDKYYRLVTPSPGLDTIEQAMLAYCNDQPPEQPQSSELIHKYPRLGNTKLGRKVLEVLESIEISLPEGLRL